MLSCTRTFCLCHAQPLCRLFTSHAPASVGGAGAERKPQKGATAKAVLELSRRDWLISLSPSPSPRLVDRQQADDDTGSMDTTPGGVGSLLLPPNALVLGIDPDVSGAMAVLYDNGASHSQVFDVPSLRVTIGSRQRRRHDTRAIVDLINNLNIPLGSVAYIEQSTPMPTDGKQGWWGSGFGYGVWIGTLVALGVSVIPIPPQAWKRAMGLAGRTFTKDDCRACASSIFPALATQLKRKKDHGRAEALLIAAYGVGLFPPGKDKVDESNSDESPKAEDSVSHGGTH